MPCFCTLLAVVACPLSVGAAFTSETALRNHLLHGYDKMMPPGMRLKTTIINLTSSLAGLYDINQQAGKFSVDMYFRGHWYDPRLVYKDLNISLGYPLPRLDLRDMEYGNQLGNRIWTPDFFLTNALKSTQIAGQIMFYVEPDGRVTWSRRFVWECRCRMYFHTFPFDTQKCGLYFETYSDRAEDVELRVAVSGDSGFSSVTSNQWKDFKESRSSKVAVFSTGNFSSAAMMFSMQRRSTAWIIDGIGLSNLFVTISYCGFWIAKEAAPARIALSIICVLIATSNYARISASMPVVTYRVWIKDYLLGCIFFNLIAVLSYSVVNFGLQQKAKPERPKVRKMNAPSYRADKVLGKADSVSSSPVQAVMDYPRMENAIDRRVREREQTGDAKLPRGDVDDVADIESDDPEAGRKRHAIKEHAHSCLGCCYYGHHRVPFIHHITWVEWHLRWFIPVSFGLFNAIMWTHVDGYKPEPQK